MLRLPEFFFVYYYTTTPPSCPGYLTNSLLPSWFRGPWFWSFGFVVDTFWSTCCRWVCLCSYFMDRLQVTAQELYFTLFCTSTTNCYSDDYWRWLLFMLLLLPMMTFFTTTDHGLRLPSFSTTPPSSGRCRSDVFLRCRWWCCLPSPFRPAAFLSSRWWSAVFVRQSSFVCWWTSTTPMMGLSSPAPYSPLS